MKETKKSIEEMLKQELQQQRVPDSLKPEQMQKRLETGSLKRKHRIPAMLATAAVAVLVIGVSAQVYRMGNKGKESVLGPSVMDVSNTTVGDTTESGYHAFYEHFRNVVAEKVAYAEESGTNQGAYFEGEKTSARGDGVLEDSVPADYGTTNVQVASIDEADVVKNDGRYLYQISQKEYCGVRDRIQIVDTQNGLKEVAEIDGFDDVVAFYVYQDLLIVIDRENVVCQEFAPLESGDTLRGSSWQVWSKLHVYDIHDRSQPKHIKTFTLRGENGSSRIADGYLYFMAKYEVNDVASESAYESYIPTVEGTCLKQDCLYLPKETDATGYLILCSIDLEHPTELADTKAVVSDGEQFYVSNQHIYVLDACQEQASEQLEEGTYTNWTTVTKYGYQDGKITLEGETKIEGAVLDQFAMDEYDGNFRVVTSVESYRLTKEVDDADETTVGYRYQELEETNCVYVLDEALQVIGTIRDLAPGERVYSARFMDQMGYFVTFRQVDPLFSVDFTDPTNPKVVGALEISGFSEYLHFYGENLLLGIGYEADETTGAMECVKLSMFDLSDPTNVKEVQKTLLKDCYYSDAMDDHKAVLVNPSKNIIGFAVNGEEGQQYRLYSYDREDGFREKFEIVLPKGEEYITNLRGTYIGDTFYLMKQRNGIGAYALQDGTLLEEWKNGTKN